jgi:hypothetical protein
MIYKYCCRNTSKAEGAGEGSAVSCYSKSGKGAITPTTPRASAGLQG